VFNSLDAVVSQLERGLATLAANKKAVKKSHLLALDC
jgi:hypothetical protein